MAQSPTVERPPRLPLIISPENRADSVNKDARLVNCFVETFGEGEEAETWLYKRPGLDETTTLSGGAGRGIYNWKGDIYAIAGTTFYKNAVNTGTVDGTGGVYRFSSCLGATPKLVLGNGVKAYTYDAGAGLVEITDVDFVKPYVKGWAYLDGTTYYLTAADAAIRGSDINDPQAWDALNKLLAQIEPDGGVALGKQLVYVVAMKQWTTEIFYDAANASGSPLGRVEGAKINFGCVSADSVQDCDGDLLFLGSNRSAGIQIIMISNVKASVVSTKAVERLLNNADTSSIYSWQFNPPGHRFYGITLVNENLTLVYDIMEERWHQWTDSSGNYFPIVSSTFSSANQHLLQHTNGSIYTCSEEYVTDDGALITMDIITPNFDGGTRRKKMMGRLTFIADQSASANLLVRVSDDDYQTWSNWRTVDLAQRVPFLSNCGSFYKRAHQFRHTAAEKFRIQAVEMQLDIGVL